MKPITTAALAALALAAVIFVIVGCGQSDHPAEVPPTAVERLAASWHADLNETLEKRRFIRVLVTYNQTNFFIDKGTPRGIEYDLLRRYEDFLNKNRPPKSVKVKLVFSVMPFERLITALLDGQGDIVAAGLTVTPERSAKVAFTRPYIENVSEVVVTKAGATLQTLDDLLGRQVHVLAGSSYANHLQQLSKELRKGFRGPIRVVEADPHLEEEDLLQMVNAGIFDITVVDAHIADVWSKVLENIAVHTDLAITQGGAIAWAVRKENPQLLASLNAFLRTNRQGTFAGNMLIKRYYENTRWLNNPLSDQERQRFEDLTALFQKYALQYGFDWLKVAALAYQESRLNQNAKSHRGAVGIMQLLPVTAANPPIEIADISTVENNIHAGVKYLAYLRDTYFNDPQIKPEHRTDFAMAAYNAGPARINYMRRKAETLELDPNVWFNNVEFAVRKFVGREPVQYVSNIYAYYVAYRTAFSVMQNKPVQDGGESAMQNFPLKPQGE